ncbi:unnamed protein product, partial [Discosporangium mesarthrocarpum]
MKREPGGGDAPLRKAERGRDDRDEVPMGESSRRQRNRQGSRSMVTERDGMRGTVVVHNSMLMGLGWSVQKRFLVLEEDMTILVYASEDAWCAIDEPLDVITMTPDTGVETRWLYDEQLIRVTPRDHAALNFGSADGSSSVGSWLLSLQRAISRLRGENTIAVETEVQEE